MTSHLASIFITVKFPQIPSEPTLNDILLLRILPFSLIPPHTVGDLLVLPAVEVRYSVPCPDSCHPARSSTSSSNNHQGRTYSPVVEQESLVSTFPLFMIYRHSYDGRYPRRMRHLPYRADLQSCDRVPSRLPRNPGPAVCILDRTVQELLSIGDC